ncbi:hypothetical protein GCM10009551_046400 [Nocardiopsis tropica]
MAMPLTTTWSARFPVFPAAPERLVRLFGICSPSGAAHPPGERETPGPRPGGGRVPVCGPARSASPTLPGSRRPGPRARSGPGRAPDGGRARRNRGRVRPGRYSQSCSRAYLAASCLVRVWVFCMAFER